MSETKLCRICLRTNAKVFDYDSFQLKYYYEQVMAKTVTDSDGLPHTFCYECATLLHKFHMFKEKCYKGEKALKDILKSGQIIIKSELNSNIKRLNLQSPLHIISKNKRTKTYLVKHKTKISDLIVGPEEKKVEKIEIISDSEVLVSDHDENIDSDDTPSDRDELIDCSTLDGKNPDPIKEEKAIELIKDEDLEDIMTLSEVKKSIKTEVNVIEKAQTESEDDMVCSEVFCDVEKEVELPVKKAVGKKKKSRNEKLYQKSSKFYKKKRKGLDPANWNQFNLTEDEALKAFHAKAEDSKYLVAPFKCYNCYKPFLTQETLNRHMQLIHREALGPLECRFCHMRFKWKCFLTRHIKKHYTKFECLRCSYICAMESTAFLHEETHSGVKIKCKYCVEEFRHRSTYYTHLRNHRSDYICSLCGASFVSEAGVHMHKRVKHVDVIEAEEVTEERKEVSTYCEPCDVVFDTQKAYEQHLLHSAAHAASKQTGDEKNGCKDLNQGIKKRRRKRSPCMRIISEDGKDTSMYCERCDIRFETQKAYEQHLLHSAMHPGGIEAPDDQIFENELKLFKNGKKRGGIRRRKPTTCHHCNKQFETQSACFKHHLAEHPRTPFCPERHICEICGASLAPGSIASHLNTHTRAVLHTCDTCGKQFSTNMVLKRHQVTHTGQKPYPCTHCEKRFTQKNSMELHFKTFHLKQPYPKRNRKKKSDGDDFRMEIESDAS